MTTTSAARPTAFGLGGLALAAAFTLAAPAASAQQIYRSVGPDGRVTFSDKPPVTGAQVAGRGGESSGPALPFAVSQAASRFPVTLYTGNGCAPCATGRNLLTARGIPFNERIISSQEDVDALKRISGEAGLPFLTIGGQQIKGFAEAEWVQFLDAAGYPKTSQLPAGYRNPAPTPLVARAEPAPPPAPAAPATSATAPVAPPPANPAGIRF